MRSANGFWKERINKIDNGKRNENMRIWKAVLFYSLQFSWGILQNLAGGIGYLVLRGCCRQERFHYSFITYVRAKNFGGVSFGIFIFINPDYPENWLHDTCIHEYGHTIQSLFLGPLQPLVIGIPSAIWCYFPPCVQYRERNNVSYYKLYCEGWANVWGLRWSKGTFKHEHTLQTGRFGKPI